MSDFEIKEDFNLIDRLIKELNVNYHVDIGVLGEKGSTDAGGITVAGLAAVHEFGAVINHPGGTQYLIQENGRSKFIKKGSGKFTGVTKAHIINIPKRSVIVDTLFLKQNDIQIEISKKIQGFLDNGNIEGIFKLIGTYGEKYIQEAFETGGFGNWQALKAATINKKGSASILIDTALLRKSYSSKVGC